MSYKPFVVSFKAGVKMLYQISNSYIESGSVTVTGGARGNGVNGGAGGTGGSGALGGNGGVGGAGSVNVTDPDTANIYYGPAAQNNYPSGAGFFPGGGAADGFYQQDYTIVSYSTVYTYEIVGYNQVLVGPWWNKQVEFVPVYGYVPSSVPNYGWAYVYNAASGGGSGEVYITAYQGI